MSDKEWGEKCEKHALDCIAARDPEGKSNWKVTVKPPDQAASIRIHHRDLKRQRPPISIVRYAPKTQQTKTPITDAIAVPKRTPEEILHEIRREVQTIAVTLFIPEPPNKPAV